MSSNNNSIDNQTALNKSAISLVREMADDATPVNILSVAVPGLEETIPLATIFKGEGKGHELIDLSREADKWRDAPRRKEGTATALTVQSFIDLVDRHKDDNSVIFANILDIANPVLTAVFDYHHAEGGAARFGEHRAIHKFPLSVEWRTWAAKSSREMAQAAFADWLEDHLAELAVATDTEKTQYEEALGLEFGTPRDIMTLSRGLSVNVSAKVVNAGRAQNGTGAVVFEEEHTGSDGKALKVPGLFMLAIPLFFGGGLIRVPVRLRYRLGRDGEEKGKILWTVILHRPQEIVYDALKESLSDVEAATGLPIYEGAPED